MPGTTEAARPARRGAARSLYLASASPRRQSLLAEGGFAHKVISPGLDDGQLEMPAGTNPREWVGALAYLKAASALEHVGAGTESPVVLAADTVVVANGRVLGQARDAQDARRMLGILSDAEHEAYTGAAILDGETRRILVDVAQVTVGALPSEVVEDYVHSGLWAGKAGAYNLVERLEAGWPIQFRGDPATIMGLPMRLLSPLLLRLLAPGA